MDLARALLFLYRLLGAPDRTPGDPILLAVGDRRMEADVYRPAGPPWATVLAVHGLALLGHRDPRLMSVGRALAATGVQTVAPRIESMAQLRLDPPASDGIADALRAALDRADLGRPSQIGVFGPSYAGGQALLAAAEPDLRDRVGGMLLIGAYADARGLLHHLMDADHADPYGRWILMRHFLDHVGELTPGLAAAIDAGLADMGLHTTSLAAVVERLGPEDLAAYLALRDDRDERIVLADRILRGHAEAVDMLSVARAIPEVRAPVTLLHGAHDPVIPPSESEHIRDLLASSGQYAVLVATTLLDHGNVTAKARAVGEVPSVIAAFVRWFRTLRRRPRALPGGDA